MRKIAAKKELDTGRAFGSAQGSGAPNITGAGPKIEAQLQVGGTGSLYYSDNASNTSMGGGGAQWMRQLMLDASRSSKVYQSGLTEIRPTNIAVSYVIKY